MAREREEDLARHPYAANRRADPGAPVPARLSDPPDGKQRSRAWATVVTLATAYWYYAVTTLALALVLPPLLGWGSTTILSGSMEPLLRPGDVVSFEPFRGETLHPGMIINFEDPARPGESLTHRVVAVEDDGRYRTQGDANPTPDSAVVEPDSITGVGRFVTPHAGLPSLWLATERRGPLAAWAILTVGAIWVIGAEQTGRRPGRHSLWRLVRPATATALIVTSAGLGFAGLARAAFASPTASDSNMISAAGSFPTPGHLGTAVCSNGSHSTVVLDTNVPAGSTIVIAVILRDRTGNAPFQAEDSVGNGYGIDGEAVNGTAAHAAILSGLVTAPLGPGDEIKISHPRGAASMVILRSFDGIDPQTATMGAATGTGADPVTVVAAPGGAIVVGATAGAAPASGYSAPDGWQLLGDEAADCGGAFAAGSAWRSVGLLGDVDYSPFLDAAAAWAQVVVAYPTG